MSGFNVINQSAKGKMDWKRLFLLIPVVAILNTGLLYGLFMNPISQSIIFSTDYEQSTKLVEVWEQIEPIPTLISLSPALIISPIVYCIFFTLFFPALPGKTGVKKGLFFGVMLWSLIALFFELFTPFGLFGEPLHLLLYELMLWFIGLTTVGTVMGMIYGQRPVSINLNPHA